MPNGFGRGTGFGRGFGGGMGFGFRGASPPWPYVGRGRGGLPRCGYFWSGAGAPVPWSYPPGAYSFSSGAPYASGYAPFTPKRTREEELDYLRDQAEAVRGELEEIEARMRDLESKQKG
jgi:hypothetical protein